MNTENNKIIVEFMDWLVRDFNPSDWNDVIEVVEKIEKSKYFHEINIFYDSVYKENNCLIIPSQKNTFNQIQCNAGTKIEAVYNACIAFIKWYNEQNKN